VYQINQRTGKAIISSYGEINTILFSKNKKGHININNTQTGQNLARKSSFKDISMSLETGDSLIFYTRGVKNAASEEGQVYGEDRIIANVKYSLDLPSRDVIHSLTETIYDFTNYSNPAADIILMCIRKI
jgi:serine phosphatase RsbU (regulator of sigma subunit)